ncbi:LysR family transcriptional regulator [Paenibacillus sp. MWE-103]|uniref:LysR family transcriptional regulator n=1 Tax=Paenibacillus artemisiicola TaxID=1172618 RepID=A0ABS3WFC9_9BACL|nr:LysR family transcriptional regulator [Paenibacillus artemisiicola]MBO7746815.1 LysR family transcriptional regulator [Paenibacillus artemisiicola]
MEWQQLEYFRVVAGTEHFTQAAERLAISQPALSRSITHLEETLGVPLFDRVGRSVKLNAYGASFLKRVERALQEIQDGMAELQQLRDPYTGTVSLSFVMTFGLSFLPDFISSFNRLYPQVKLQLFQNTTAAIARQLQDGEADLSIVGSLDHRNQLEWHKLLDEDLFAYVPAKHRLADRESIRLEELAGEPFIGFKKGYGMRDLTDRFCAQAGFAPQVVFEGEDVATVSVLVSSGIGVTLIPSFRGITPSKIKKLRVEEPACRREIGLAWQKGRTLSPAAELFRSFIIGQFA